MSAAAKWPWSETHFVDVLGIDIRRGDRVWLVSEHRNGLDMICAGTVLDFADGRVRWVEDITRCGDVSCTGAEVDCDRTISVTSPSLASVHFSLPSALKVTKRAEGAVER